MVSVYAREVVGIPSVYDHFAGPLYPYVEAVARAILGDERRSVDAEGDTVIFPGVVIVPLRYEPAISLWFITLRSPRSDVVPCGRACFYIRLEDKRERFGLARPDDL